MCVVVCLLSTDCRNAQKNLQLNVAFFFYIIFKNTISNSIRVLRLRGGGVESYQYLIVITSTILPADPREIITRT